MRQSEIKQLYFNHGQIKQPHNPITEKNGSYIGSCLDKFRNYKVYVTATKGTQESYRVDFFPTKSRLSDTDSIDRRSAAHEDLKHEYTPSSTNHLVVDSKHGTDLNKVIKRMKKLFQPTITTTSNLINNLFSSKVTPNLVPRATSTLFTRVDTIPIHNNSISIQQPGVSEATNRYTIGTNINKFFDRTYYCGNITADNGN